MARGHLSDGASGLALPNDRCGPCSGGLVFWPSLISQNEFLMGKCTFFIEISCKKNDWLYIFCCHEVEVILESVKEWLTGNTSNARQWV